MAATSRIETNLESALDSENTSLTDTLEVLHNLPSEHAFFGLDVPSQKGSVDELEGVLQYFELATADLIHPNKTYSVLFRHLDNARSELSSYFETPNQPSSETLAPILATYAYTALLHGTLAMAKVLVPELGNERSVEYPLGNIFSALNPKLNFSMEVKHDLDPHEQVYTQKSLPLDFDAPFSSSQFMALYLFTHAVSSAMKNVLPAEMQVVIASPQKNRLSDGLYVQATSSDKMYGSFDSPLMRRTDFFVIQNLVGKRPVYSQSNNTPGRQFTEMQLLIPY